jgi:hypothetical protein
MVSTGNPSINIQFTIIILKRHFEITNSLNMHPKNRFSSKVEVSIPTVTQAASTLMHNTSIYPNESRTLSFYPAIKLACSRVCSSHRLYTGLMKTKTKFTGNTKWRKVRTNINVPGGNRSHDAVVRLRN